MILALIVPVTFSHESNAQEKANPNLKLISLKHLNKKLMPLTQHQT